MRRRRLILAMALALAIPFAMAQQKPAENPAAKPAPEKAAPQGGGFAAQPPAEMQKLKFLVGRWMTSEKFEPSDFMPKGGTGSGRADIHPGPGGLSLMENYHSKNDVFGRFGGHAVMWWDAKGKQYKSFWCDSMAGCEPAFGVGQWQGDKLVFTGETEFQGKKISMRDTFSDIKPDSFTWMEETSADGGPMKPAMVLQYTRAMGRKPAEQPSPAPAPTPKM